jgi:hypothetical protein
MSLRVDRCRLRRLALLLLAPLASVAGGCNIVAPIAYAIEGPGTIDAEFDLARVDTTVIVDDQGSLLPRLALRTALGESIGERLLRERLVPQVVSPRDAIAFMRSNDRRATPASIESVARAVGAKQVVYVQLVGFSLVGPQGEARPNADMLVRVLCMEGRTRVYPADPPEGRFVTTMIREVDPELYRTPATRRQIEEQLVQRMAVDVAKLFHKHDRVEFGENLRSR